MNMFRIALANIRFPATPKESVTLAEQAIAQASLERAGLICFPECFTPGYRVGKPVPPPDPAFLERAWCAIAAAAAKANLILSEAKNLSPARCQEQEGFFVVPQGGTPQNDSFQSPSTNC